MLAGLATPTPYIRRFRGTDWTSCSSRREAVLKRDALGIRLAKERCAELSPVPPVALAAERLHARVGRRLRVGIGSERIWAGREG